MRISDIKPQKKRKDRVNIYLDGVFSFGLDLENVVKNHLKVGMELTADDVSRLTGQGANALLYNKILALISRRPRTEKEIRDYLTKNEAGQTVAEVMIAKLKERKFLDDVAFAKWFVEQRSAFRPKGKTALTQELRQKGIDRELIADTFENEPVDEVTLARSALAKKLRQFDRLPPDKRKEKIIGFLSRRGFSWDTVRKVLGSDID